MTSKLLLVQTGGSTDVYMVPEPEHLDETHMVTAIGVTRSVLEDFFTTGDDLQIDNWSGPGLEASWKEIEASLRDRSDLNNVETRIVAENDGDTITVLDEQALANLRERFGMMDYGDAVPGGSVLADCEMSISQAGQVSISEVDPSGVMPVAQYNRRTLVYPLPELANANLLRTDLAAGGPLALLIDVIISGHSVDIRGPNGVGRLTSDAQEASDHLAELLTDDGYASDIDQWEPTAWFVDDTPQTLAAKCGLTIASTDEDVSAAVQRLHQDALDQQAYVEPTAIEQYLRDGLA